MKLFIIKVTGLVQGVNFRYYAKKKADELGIFGYVKNLDDGSVEILSVGRKSDLDNFIEWCNHGPQYAEVKNVDVKEINSTEKFNNFEVRY